MYTSRLQFNKIKTQQIPVYCVSFALRYFVCHYKDYYYYYYIILQLTLTIIGYYNTSPTIQQHRDLLWVFNDTCNNISVISWWSVLLVEVTRVPSRELPWSVNYAMYKLEDFKIAWGFRLSFMRNYLIMPVYIGSCFCLLLYPIFNSYLKVDNICLLIHSF